MGRKDNEEEENRKREISELDERRKKRGEKVMF